MGKTKNKPMWVLFLVMLALFFVGIVCEFVLKYAHAVMVTNPAEGSGVVWRRVLTFFGDQATPIWLFPSLGLNWIPVRAGSLVLNALRWLPFLCALLLPVFGALFRQKAIVLIPCALLSCCIAVGMVLTLAIRKLPTLTYWHAIPYAAETLVLILACLALFLKSKGFSVAMGVVCVLFALLSIAATALFSGLDPALLKYGFAFGNYLYRRFLVFPASFMASYWPAHKAISFVLYALLLFAAPKQFPKKRARA